ncbi:MAG TPA: glycosyltransferase [Patescibacteria group bacterium]|jgi:cellulose synthase/poly-beta-1,6-N-acetylglucosamine synthase-like glycosyltransferase|nr:glycosyltransferase [Patescibacteria group bacterium]
MKEFLVQAIVAFNDFVLIYFLSLNAIYLLLFVLSLYEVLKFIKRTFFSDYQQILQSDMTWPISILVPAHNEERNIVETVRSLQLVNYGEFEIIVINDDSTDRTLKNLIEAFDLRRVDRVYKRSLETKPIRGIYGSLTQQHIVVIDKERGGKSDALNAGVNLSRYPLFCSVDADSIIEDNALLRVVKPFMEHPTEMVAVGGIVRIANGCEVHEGRVSKINLPTTWLPILQVIEYLRAFLTGRIGWSVMRSLLIISGAFGLYKKSEVIEVGGYDSESDTEDLELVVRLHENCRRKKMKYRIVFVPDPVCWTEVPATFQTLRRQRNRWHRGLLQSLWRHKGMFLNPRYGIIGMFTFPYFVVFEMFGPFVELTGYVTIPLAWWLGILNTRFLVLFFVLAVLCGVFLSVAAILLEEISFRRYPRWIDLAKLVVFGIMENFFYRQVLSLFKVKAFFDFLRRRRGWGDMKRRGFERRAPA